MRAAAHHNQNTFGLAQKLRRSAHFGVVDLWRTWRVGRHDGRDFPSFAPNIDGAFQHGRTGPTGASFSLDHMSTLWGKRVAGILGGEGRSASLIGALIALNKQGRFPYDKLITEFPLDQVNDALEASRAGDVIKPVLRMPEP